MIFVESCKTVTRQGIVHLMLRQFITLIITSETAITTRTSASVGANYEITRQLIVSSINWCGDFQHFEWSNFMSSKLM